ncbi:MAG: FitA-like ribbon-helix-helix domain-containing protein [Chloroflexota bacterium]
MSVAITVRNVPEPVRDELAARAARSGRTLG